tara:strand:+ start:15078 stop:15332 length:255 start_codon:yes stop_codon:yes gene_type:complete
MGKQYLIKLILKEVSFFFEKNICNKLTVVDNGSNIFNTSKYSYPNNKKVGVPKTNNPTPNTDWKKVKINIKVNSKGLIRLYNKD